VLHELARIIPGARTEVLPGLGHNAPDENAPARVALLLRRHLAAGQ
jgi:pimeloyl-ACP methyl ester carboxylesterase